MVFSDGGWSQKKPNGQDIYVRYDGSWSIGDSSDLNNKVFVETDGRYFSINDLPAPEVPEIPQKPDDPKAATPITPVKPTEEKYKSKKY